VPKLVHCILKLVLIRGKMMECLHTQRRGAGLRSIFVNHERLDGNKSAEFLNCLRFGDLISDSNSLGGHLEGL